MQRDLTYSKLRPLLIYWVQQKQSATEICTFQ